MRIFCFLAVGVIALYAAFAGRPAYAVASTSPAPNSAERKLSCPARFITCMAWDKFRHCVWIGTEGHGIYEYRPWASGGKRWLQFSKTNGLSDNSCYAIAIDDKARIWAGTDRHGVEVLISRRKPWQRYDVLPLTHKGRFGPLGSHPFCIAVDPYTGAVWLGTEAGISIYSTRRHTWRYLTVANGLPSDQINTINFLPQGKVILGTQCDGVDIGTPETHRHRLDNKMVLSSLPGFRDPYRWQVITGPFHTPDSATGSGLPSSLINAVLVPATPAATARLSAYQLARAARHQNIDIGTDSGLAISRNGGQRWNFEQGRDYAARVLGLFHPPAGFRAPPQAQLASLLSGEHITCVARDAAGNLWLGFWRDGYMVISPHGHHIYRTDGDPRFAKTDTYVQAILPLPNGKVLIGRYGHGVSIINPKHLSAWLKPGGKVKLFAITRPNRMLMPVRVQYPQAAAVPTAKQIVALRNALLRVKPDKSTAPEIIPLSDDWRTRGNELGNYGRLLGFLGAMNHIIDRSTTGAYWFKAGIEGFIDTHWRPGDGIRRWVSEKSSADPRALQNPSIGMRTMSSWDDHGETYPGTDDGPNLYFTMAIPKGQYIISLYFVNDDAHTADYNRPRDYTIGLRSTRPMSNSVYGGLPFTPAPGLSDYRQAVPMPRMRVSQFWPGVYKRFFVSLPAGKGSMAILRVLRNYSMNTILSGIFIDRLYQLPKLRVVPPLVLAHRPFRSYPAWKRDPVPPDEVASIAKIFYRGALLQIKLGNGTTTKILHQDAVSTARQEILSRDVLNPHPARPKFPIPPALTQEFRQTPPNQRWRLMPKFAQAQRDYFHNLWRTAAGRRGIFLSREAYLSPAARAIQAVMRQLLYLRQANAGWVAANGRIAVVMLTHFLLAPEHGVPRGAVLSKVMFPLPILSRYFLASLVGDVGLPQAANRVFPRQNNYALFAYDWKADHPKVNLPNDGVAYQRIFLQWTKKQTKKEMLKW